MITVIMATRNGASTLPRTLESLCRQEDPGAPWRIVVVENGCTDATPEVLAAFAPRLPLTRLHVPRAGQNAARNVALASLDADPGNGLVVFADDDIVADRRWLAEFAAAAARHSGFSLFGGRIEPAWPGTPPDWLLAAVPSTVAYAATDPGLDEIEVPAWQIFGPSMAVRGALFQAGHRFLPTVGPDGTVSYAMGSETEFLVRMARLGHRALHCPRVRAHHLVRPHQLAPAWLRGRARRSGRGRYGLARLTSLVRPSRSEGVALLRRVLALAVRRAGGFGTDRVERLRRDWELHVAIGELLAWRAIRKQGRQRRAPWR